jgi:PPOX class probable FMN-dependent enzyme
MALPDARFDISQESELLTLFETPREASIVKQLDHISAHYAAWIAASPFLVMSTVGPGGVDASPRGDPAGFVEVHDSKTLLLPERRGNNRIDSLRNLVADPRLALLFLIPGIGETLRVNGRGRINVDPELLGRFALQGRAPKLVIVMTVEAVYFQCSRALVRSDLWNAERQLSRTQLPTVGKILEQASAGRIDGEAYDRELPERVNSTLY